jgi:tight adherence protein B
MTLVAAMCSGVFVYLLVGYVTGYAPRLDLGSLGSGRGRSESLRLWLAQTGLRITPVQFVGGSAALAVAAFAILLLLTGSIGLAAVPSLLVALLPRVYYARQRTVRLREVQEAWPDGVHELVANIAAGRSLPQAIAELSRRGPPPLREAFARFPILAASMGTVPALEVIREELADPLSDRVIEVLVLAHDQGGPAVTEILRDLAQAAGKDRKALEEIKTNQLEQRINAWAVSAMPWAVLLLLTSRAGHFRDFYRSGAGLLVIAIGGALTLVGLWWLTRLGRQRIEERVFGWTETAAESGGAR